MRRTGPVTSVERPLSEDLEMFRAYFDRSSVPRYGSVAVAGWVMLALRWNYFEPNWYEVLRSFGVSHLHMTDFEGGHKEFQGWTPDRKRDFMRQVIGVLRRAGPLGVSVGLLQSDLDGFLDLDQQREHVSAYGLCAVHAIGRMMKEIKSKGVAQPLACVFESGDDRKGQIIAAVTGARKKSAEYDKRLESLRFEEKGSAWGLEAADLLAYEAAKHIPRKVGLDPTPIRKSLWRLLHRTQHISIHLDVEVLRRSLFIETTFMP